MKIEVDSSDLEKLFDVLSKAFNFHLHRDEMNACLHLAEKTRQSPLTSELSSASERVLTILRDAKP